MRHDYDGVKYFSATDRSIGWSFKKAQTILDAFSTEKSYENINEILELYNVYQIIFSGGIKKEYTVTYEEKAKSLMKTIAVFFKGIDDSCLIEQYNGVSVNYLEDFWTLFEKFAVYKRISQSVFLKLLEETDIHLRLILCHKKIVDYYDSVLTVFMRQSDQSAEIIISVFLERRSSTDENKSILPKSLQPKEYEDILLGYINSDYPNVGLLQLLASSQSSGECPISDQLRLSAKRKAAELWKSRSENSISIAYGVGVCFKENPDFVTLENEDSREFLIVYDANWIRENLDYPTLLNNFIYMFQYVDMHYRCSFPAKQNQFSVLEQFGIKGIKQYDTNTMFDISNVKSNVELRGYSEFLSNYNIQIEDVIKWFFEEYLKEEFGADGFVINLPSKENTLLQKCRDLPSEMDGVLKQFRLFVENGVIDRELFEMSSNPCVFSGIPSMLSRKYAYPNSDEIKKEQYLLLSTQNLLRCLPKNKCTYNNFFELLSEQEVRLSDYNEMEQTEIKWLESRGALFFDEEGIIRPIKKRVMVLKDLFEHEVICPLHYRDTSIIEKMICDGDLYYSDSLFSLPEQKYLNYMLNKSEYSNGLDLRNKYIHSSYPTNEEQQATDYYSLLKIMVVVVLKINEEFCLKYPQEKKDLL